ncbi:galactose oxidase-like protein [Chitinophaga skermanii]|uniref:Galactose oxidase-like protein n=1 Tax=Chitinophaga skermanii TaxID=331697 RepID=A0A327QG59_9BACT|nr:kelch repeat-containing protein [Chitinophaga skermanii]RAJ02632.1 galactose oxidase-like protein [Chitinophaga skermanii]
MRYVSNYWMVLLVALAACQKSSDSTETNGNWIKRSEFEGVARNEAVSFVIDNKAYVGTGFDGENRLKDFWMYDQASNYWSQKADFPGAARSSAIGMAIGSKGYIGTGYDGTNKLADFYEYNPTTNAWEKKADFTGSGRYGATAFAINNKGYITCGYDGNYLKDFYEFEPTTNVWTKRESMGGTKRTDAVAFVIDNKAYLVTGSNNGQNVNDLWVFDGSAWTEKRKITNVSDDDYDNSYDIPRNGAIAFVMNNKGYVTLGSKSGLASDVWEYDPINDLWDTKTSFEGVARSGAVAFTLNNRGYVALGNSLSQQFDDLWEFDPSAEYNKND